MCHQLQPYMWTSKKHRLLLWEIIIQYLTTIGTKKIFGKDPHYNFSKGELDVKIQLQSTSVDFKHFVKPTINQVERFRNNIDHSLSRLTYGFTEVKDCECHRLIILIENDLLWSCLWRNFFSFPSIWLIKQHSFIYHINYGVVLR